MPTNNSKRRNAFDRFESRRSRPELAGRTYTNKTKLVKNFMFFYAHDVNVVCGKNLLLKAQKFDIV